MNGNLEGFKQAKQDGYILDLINGFIRVVFNRWVPDIISYNIVMFYSIKNMKPCMIFDNQYNNKTNDVTNIINVVCNQTKQFYLTNSNELYVSGNEILGLGLPEHTPNISKLIKMEASIFDSGIELVSHGQYNWHGFVYTKKGTLYSFGENHHHQCGIISTNKDNKVIWTPKIVKYTFFDSLLTQIDCGQYHSLFLTSNGTVYGSGSNSYKQLTSKYQINKYIRNRSSIIKLSGFKDIKSVACTTFSSAVLDNNGVIYTFGDNSDAVLGVPDDRCEKINKLDKVSCHTISGGSFHIGCLTDNNKGYFFGYNEYGQCGVKSPNLIYNPIIIELDTKLSSVKCGRYHTIIKTINEEYYSFGNNDTNECLLMETDSHEIMTPTKISIKDIQKKLNTNKCIIDIIPGCSQTFILLER